MLKNTSCNLIAEMINKMSVQDMYEFVVEHYWYTLDIYPREGLIEELSNNSNLEELLDTIMYGGSAIMPEHQWYILGMSTPHHMTIVSLCEQEVRPRLEKIVVDIINSVGIHTPSAYEMLYEYTARHFE